MNFRDTIAVTAPIAEVWALVVDPTSIAGCIPGVQEVRRIDDRAFEGAVTASVGPVEGRFSFTAVIADQSPPERLTVEVRGTDSVTRSRLEADVDVELAGTAGSATTLTYRATLRVQGRLAILGEMVLRATAGMMIEQVTRCLRERLEAHGQVGDLVTG
jgi:hypothetical protein